MKYIDGEAIDAVTDYLEIVEALRRMYVCGCDNIARWVLRGEDVDGISSDCLTQPAWPSGEHFGLKHINVFPGNLSRGVDTVQGVYLLFDGATGVPLACLDGAVETLVKTAANSALASLTLSRPDSSVIGVLGAGRLAPYLVRAHVAVRPIRKIKLWNRTIGKAHGLKASLQGLARILHQGG